MEPDIKIPYVDEKCPSDVHLQLPDDLQPQSPLLEEQRPRTPRRDIIFRCVISALLVLFFASNAIHPTLLRSLRWSGNRIQKQDGRIGNMDQQMINSGKLVPLEAHIMSKCPDAKDCLQQLIVPTMVQVSSKVNFTLSYIGSYDPDSDAVSCKHGPGECLGNIIQLCAAKEYPDPKLYLGFANCMISQYRDIPNRDLVEYCAMEHGIDFGRLNACISEEGEGTGLLRASFDRSRQNNATISCTVRLAGETRCIRDGNRWYDCPGGSSVADLVRDIEKLYG